MADDPVDISGMPDPGSIGLNPVAQVDPTVDMPDPANLYQQHYGDAPRTKEALDEFMANPPEKTKPLTAREAASKATGIPRAAAGYALAIPAGVASLAGQGVGALGAALDPDHAGTYLEQGRERGREWAEKVSKLADYVPATKGGAEFSNEALALPGQAIKDTAGTILKRTLPDNAYQAVADVAQDVGNDLPALGVPAVVRGATRVAKAGARAVTPKAAPPVEAPLKPDFKESVSPESLRAAPNPIPPPEGTQAHADIQAAAEPAAEPQPAATAPRPAAGEVPPTGAANLPATDNAPQDMNLSPDERALVREGVAARRAAAESQRGSVRLFNSPAEEGPKETPQPEQQNERQTHLDALDKLSGGKLPTRRTSALTGDYNATGDDYQMKEVGNEQMRKQLASENDALHAATENVHNSVGSDFENSVDSTTLGDRGRVTRNAIQGIEKHFDDATDELYDHARASVGNNPIPKLQRVTDYLNDDSNFTNDAEIGLQRAAKQRLERLWSTGDPAHNTPPGSVTAAERFREFLNEKGKNPSAMGVANDLKNHTDMDVSEHGGPGLFQTARAMRRHSYQMLEEPTGIKKLLTPSDSQGINHAIPEHKVMDYIADLPREQHEHVLNVLRASAHLDPELAKTSAAAIREIQAHAVSRIHAAATNADGTWNARKFYNAADRYARNVPETFKDRPDVLGHLKTINDAGNTLHMDKHYPGAAAQTERTGAVGHVLEAAGNIAGSAAHEIPLVGRFIGRRIENAVDRASGKIGDSVRDREVAKRLVDRTGKQRGSVGVLPEKVKPEDTKYFVHGNTHVVSSPFGHTKAFAQDGGDLRIVHTETDPKARGQGGGTARVERLAQEAHDRGGKLISDSEVSAPAQRIYKSLADKGYDVKTNPHTTDPGTGVKKSTSELKGVYEVGPKKGEGSTLNIGLHQGQEGQPGFRKMSKQEAHGAVESTGAKVTKSSVLTPDAHGVSEPTLVASTNRALSEPEMQQVLAKTKQSAIQQRTAAGEESMHVAPGHEEIAKKEGWDKFNPEYFRDHEGKISVPAGQRGSFSFENDNALNRATGAARDRQRGVGINPRNERSEQTANRQMGGQKERTAEQNDILRRLSGQRGSVPVMNDSAVPGGDKQIKSPEFKQWFGKSAVTVPYNSDNIPLVVYHGTTHDVSKFSTKGANPESDMGKGFYFSNTPEDVEHNYAGKGPDLTQKIELTAERLESNDMPRGQALARAQAKLMGNHGGMTVPAYLRIEDPAIIGNGAHGRGTELTHELEYENPDDPESDIKGETGTLPKFMDALRSVTRAAEGTGYELRTEKDLEKGLASLHEKSGYSGISLADAIEHLHDSGALLDIQDSKGNIIANELIRRALQKMGHDGIIDHTVNDKFGREPGVRSGMKGVNPDTVHYIAFKPHQIKSAIGNSGKFSRKNADITAKNDSTSSAGALA